MVKNNFPIKDVALIILCTLLFTSGFMLLKATFIRDKAPAKPIIKEIPSTPKPVAKPPKTQSYGDLLEEEKPDHPEARHTIKAKDLASIPKEKTIDNLDQMIFETLQMEPPKPAQSIGSSIENPDEEFGIL